jgi:hypothetical protein
LAIVLVVALVVVYLVGGFAGLGAGSLETQSKNYWGSTSPFSITTFKVSATTMELQVQNNDLDQLNVTAISFDGVGAGGINGSIAFNSGESKPITIPLAATCGAAGTPFTYNNVVITYDKGSITALKQAGTKPLVGKCS